MLFRLSPAAVSIGKFSATPHPNPPPQGGRERETGAARMARTPGARNEQPGLPHPGPFPRRRAGNWRSPAAARHPISPRPVRQSARAAEDGKPTARARGERAWRRDRGDGKRPAGPHHQARGHGEAVRQSRGARRPARGATRLLPRRRRQGPAGAAAAAPTDPRGRRHCRRRDRAAPVAASPMTSARPLGLRPAEADVDGDDPSAAPSHTQSNRPGDEGPLTPAEVEALQRADFYTFMVRCFAELHIGRTFSPAWHAEVLAAKLQGVHEGHMKRLVVNVPPRHLKSLAASVALPAWLLGHDPTLAIVNVTYAQDLSEKFARDCRMIMTSGWYQSLFDDPARFAARAPGRARDDPRGLSARDLGRRRADRPRRRRHPDRRPAEADRRHVAEPPRRRQRLVRLDALFAAQRQAEGGDRHRHAAPARGRSRRPRARPGRLGRRLVSGRRRRGRGARDRDAARALGVPPLGGRSARSGARAASRARAHSLDDRGDEFRRPVPAAARAGRRRHGQGGLAPALPPRRPAFLRPHRAELGHCQQAERAFRLFGLHHLGR